MGISHYIYIYIERERETERERYRERDRERERERESERARARGRGRGREGNREAPGGLMPSVGLRTGLGGLGSHYTILFYAILCFT